MPMSLRITSCSSQIAAPMPGKRCLVVFRYRSQHAEPGFDVCRGIHCAQYLNRSSWVAPSYRCICASGDAQDIALGKSPARKKGNRSPSRLASASCSFWWHAAHDGQKHVCKVTRVTGNLLESQCTLVYVVLP